MSFGNRGVSLFNLRQRVEFLQEHLSATRRNAPSIISDMSLREFYDGSQPRKTSPGHCHERLVLSWSLWELEVHALSGQTLVDFGVGVEAVVDTTTLLLVKDDLQNLGTVLLGTKTLADNLHWVNEVGEDGIVHSSESARAWALLGLASAAAVATLWAWQNAARGDDQDVAVREFLLELSGETSSCVRRCL